MKLYVVRNTQGKFFRPVGQIGHRDGQWQSELNKAKFYPKLSQAKSRVTFFAKNSPKFGVCDVLEFTLDVNQAVVMDMTESTNEAIEKAKIAADKYELRRREWEIQSLQAEKDAIELKIKKYAR